MRLLSHPISATRQSDTTTVTVVAQDTQSLDDFDLNIAAFFLL